MKNCYKFRTLIHAQHFNSAVLVWPICLSAIALIALLIIYNIWGSLNFWAAMAQAGGNALHFCELNRINELIRQPSNTWSNIPFITVGLFVIFASVKDWQYKDRKQSPNFMVRHPIFSFFLGLSTLYTGLGSLFYHASLTSFFQKHDQMGMYALIFSITAICAYRLLPEFKSIHLKSIYLTGALALLILIYIKWNNININLMFPLCVGMVVILHLIYEFKRKKMFCEKTWIYGAFAALVIGFIIWMLDRSHVICKPDSWLQGHAVWHILTAFSTLLTYLYFRTVSPAQHLHDTYQFRTA
ncbi:MAG: ceramidase domain-containing protein [Chitinophagales bacterium]|nr:ceramidase [Chitinophagales bacterium]MDW8272851.1 ceramidase domain-containing protein [Chitinophagales bacterium]